MKIIRKNKNKLKPKTKSKILVLGLILILVLVGLFSPMTKASAAESWYKKVINDTKTIGPFETEVKCREYNTYPDIISTQCFKSDTPPPSTKPPVCTDAPYNTSPAGCVPEGAPDPNKSAFENEITANQCGIIKGTLYPGCFIQASYGLFYVIPSWILYVSAYFFNVLINITLSSTLLTLPFVSQAWGVVRDLSNIFFILILLYIAIKVILGLGGSEVKKMIAKVVIIALLINFSMFFTQVIIDTSNILALIFYNKVSVSTKDAQGNERQYQKTGNGEKDVAGGLVNAFDPTKLISQDYLDNARKQPPINGVPVPDAAKVAPGILIGMILIAGVLMFFAAYCLLVVGLSFLGRLIELFVLIIFSPFAFMSSTVPKLAGVEYLGWDQWFKRLLTVSFMAPIFMFFLYFIFMLVKADIFKGLKTASSASMIESLLMIVLPAVLILVLLLKATKFAKEGSGAIGEMVMKGAKIAGGLALGATAGLGAVAGRVTVGRAGAAMANSRWAKNWEAKGFGGEAGMSALKKMGSGSFDARGIKIAGKDLAGATGMNLGKAQEGGFTARREKDVKKRMERAKEIEVGEDEPLKQALNTTEADLQGLLSTNTKDIEGLDKLIEKKRQEAADTERQSRVHGAATINTATGISYGDESKQASNDLSAAKENKKKLRTGLAYINHSGIAMKAIVGAGGSIDALENQQKTDTQAIKTQNVVRRQAYAKKLEGGGNRALNFVFSGGQYALKRGANEAAHKIRMETKLDSGTKT